MKNTTSRRLFLRNSALATTGIALFSTHIISANSKENPFSGYNEFAKESTDLRCKPFSKHVGVKGIIYNKEGDTPLKNVTIEVWHLSPSSKKYRHRAKLKSNEFGEYSFITDFPNRLVAKTPSIYFKLSHADAVVYTELALDFSGGYITSNHFSENQNLGDGLFPTSSKTRGTQTIHFNLSI